MVLPLIRNFSFNTGLGEITRDKDPSDWVSELEGVEPQHPLMVEE
jgi:hypothetical protein